MNLSPAAQNTFEKTSARSEDGLSQMREIAKTVFGDDARFIVGVNGSYARREATSGSDVDLFVLYRKDTAVEAQRMQAILREQMKEAGFKMPADDGVFASPLSVSALSQTIGGMDDTNESITRRMLLLLEGEWLYNEAGFNEAKTRLLGQYVTAGIRNEQICLFLLNDIIRYWRTICVDFEYKIQADNKPREIRLIKLRFSRMLLFFAGIMAVGATYKLDREQKIERLLELFALPAYQRLIKLAGEQASPALELYATFLNALDDPAIRLALSQPGTATAESQEFQQLRLQAQQFRHHLLTLLKNHYDSDNPTVTALML